MYREADDRMREQELTEEDVNKLLLPQHSQQTVSNFNLANKIPVISQNQTNIGAAQVIKPSQYISASSPIHGDIQRDNFKRQKISECADFTNNSMAVPIGKSSSKVAMIVANEEVPTSITKNGLSNANHNAETDCLPFNKRQILPPVVSEVISAQDSCIIVSTKPTSVSVKSRIKTVAESISKNYAENLKEKEMTIRFLEKKEESKIISKDSDELSLQIQKSIYKNWTPLYSGENSKIIKWFWGDLLAWDESKLIQWSNWGKKQHRQWIEKQKSLNPYIWVYWQFLIMDLINMPIATIIEPVKIINTDTKTIKFDLDSKYEKLITKKGPYKIEIRGLRLWDVPFKNAWPNFGEMSLNGSDWSFTLTLPEREQSRKRKDDPINLTQYFISGKKSHILSLRK